jgi:GH25 family lysozyme M1 (1,4-beta-N-acetylmuramidase)
LREIDEERNQLNAIIDVKTNGYINLCKENREMGAQMDKLLNKNNELMRITDISSK